MKQILNVLLVDDDEVDVETVQRSFAEHGLDNPITVANDGETALAILRGANGHQPLPRPYVVLLDINMPRMTGIELLNELRADPDIADSVVFMLTTSDSPSDRDAAYAQRVAGYMVKGNVGRDFAAVTGLVERYQRAVVLPAERD